MNKSCDQVIHGHENVNFSNEKIEESISFIQDHNKNTSAPEHFIKSTTVNFKDDKNVNFAEHEKDKIGMQL